MFCSVIQQHLESNFGGTFALGKLQHLELAPAVRSQINERIRLEYRVGTPSEVCSFLLKLPFL
jgi:hypothetical protein